jgi:hypothetical protein
LTVTRNSQDSLSILLSVSKDRVGEKRRASDPDASDVVEEKKARRQQENAVKKKSARKVVDPEEIMSPCVRFRVTRKRAAELGPTSLMEPTPRHDDEALMRLASMITGKVISKVIVLAGAGISTKAGIRDFRTPGE